MAAGENAPHRWRVGFTDPKGESSVPLTQRVPTVNRLLEALPSSDLRRLLAECETVELAFADVLYTSGETEPRLLADQQLRLADHANRRLFVPRSGPG